MAGLAALMTISETAKLLRVSPSTVRNWAAKGRVPFIELPGGDYRIPREELLATLRANVDVRTVLERTGEADRKGEGARTGNGTRVSDGEDDEEHMAGGEQANGWS
jgi:excisionase family DNA binding protein